MAFTSKEKAFCAPDMLKQSNKTVQRVFASDLHQTQIAQKLKSCSFNFVRSLFNAARVRPKHLHDPQYRKRQLRNDAPQAVPRSGLKNG